MVLLHPLGLVAPQVSLISSKLVPIIRISDYFVVDSIFLNSMTFYIVNYRVLSLATHAVLLLLAHQL